MSITFSQEFLQGLGPIIPDTLLRQVAATSFEPHETLVCLITLSNTLQHTLRKAGLFDSAESVASYLTPKIQELYDQGFPKKSSSLKRKITFEEPPLKRKKPKDSDVCPMEVDETNECAPCASQVSLQMSPAIERAKTGAIVPGDWENIPPEEVKRRVMVISKHRDAAEALDRYRLLELSPRETLRKIETCVQNLLTDCPSLTLPCRPGDVSAYPTLVAELFASLYVHKTKQNLCRITGSDTAIAIVREISAEEQNKGILSAARLIFARINEEAEAILDELPPDREGETSQLLDEICYPRILY